MNKKEKMLIVDDVELNRNVIATYFERDFSIAYACNGIETIEYIKNNPNPAIILLDILMPEMNGIEVLKWLNNNEYHIPVVALTADSSFQLEALENGAWDFISKPCDERIIKTRVLNVLSRYTLNMEKKSHSILKKEFYKIEHIINSIPGGIVIFKLCDPIELVFISDGAANLSGYSVEEYVKKFHHDALDIVYAEDRKRLNQKIDEALMNWESIDENYRIQHKDGSYFWIRINGVPIEYVDGFPLMYFVVETESKQNRLYDNLINKSQDAIYVSDANNYDLIYLNETASKLLRKPYHSYEGTKCYEYLFQQKKPCSFCKIKQMKKDSFLERQFSRLDDKKIYHLKGKLVNWNGLNAHIEYINDITTQKQNELKIKALNEQLSSVIENIPTGMCLYHFDGSKITPIVHNQAFYNIFGYSNENAKVIQSETNFLNVHPEDIKELQGKINNAFLHTGKVQHTYRAFNDQAKKYMWIYLNGVCVLQPDHTQLAYVSYTDVSSEREIQQQYLKEKEKSKKQFEELLTIYNSLPSGIAWYTPGPNPIFRFANEQAAQDLGFSSAKDMKDHNPISVMHFIHPEDRHKMIMEHQKLKKLGDQVNVTFRILREDHTIQYISATCCLAKAISKKVLVQMIYTNITAEKMKDDALLSEALKYEVLVNSIPGGVGIYKVDDKFTPIYISNRVCELCGLTREEYFEKIKSSSLSVFHPDDVDGLYKEIKRGLKEDTNIDYTYRLRQKDGSYKWTKVWGARMPNQNDFPVISTVFLDVDETKKIEEDLKETRLRYEVALKSSGINVWEYNIQNDTLVVFSNSSRIKQSTHFINNYIQSTIDHGYVRESSIEAFKNIFKRLNNKEKEVTEDIWYKTTDTEGWWCERVTYTTVFDENNIPIKALGAGRDVTREKEAEKQFHNEIKYREAMQSTNLESIKIDLTNDTIIECSSPFKIVQNSIRNANVNQYFENTLLSITNDKLKKEFHSLFQRNVLLNRFKNGEYSLSLEFTRTFDDHRIYWVKYMVHLMQNPSSKEITAFIYSLDITKERVTQTIMDNIASIDYDFLVIVDTINDSAIDYANKNKGMYFNETTSFCKRIRELIEKYVCEKDKKRVLKECSITNIIPKIKSLKKYNINYSIQQEETIIRRKQLQFTLIDEFHNTFLMTQIDVNDVFIEQEDSKKKLQNALETAEQANSAKSDFLARMSHDIRTPMNAILGLSKIALDEVSDPLLTQDNLNKIISSGEYLLGLLNDILDLSKIEKQQLRLHLQAYSTKQCIDEIKTIIHSQLEEKKINFMVTSKDLSENKIMLDKLRYKQIWFNLISNAIKFSPEGGTIHFYYEQIKKEGNFVTTKYYLRDNGVGMSENYLKHLFEPFTQENNDANMEHQGSGLGLAIVYNLVKLMNGDILVKSEKDVGTQFIITLTTQIANDQDFNSNNIHNKNRSLSGKKILLVEDHPLNTLIATKILRKMGILIEHAGNGKEALDLFINNSANQYDAILMDIRMPIMDGLSCAKLIRSSLKADAKSIPIIAMTANAFSEDFEDSKKAGMNAHLAKPIDTDLLFRTLSELIQ